MDQNSLVNEATDAGADLIRRFQRFKPVELAFWLRPSEESRWSLYIASEGINPTNIDIGFGEILRLVDELRTPYIDPFQVRLIGVGDPLAQAAAEINKKYPGPMANRLRGKSFGGIDVDEVYVYPSRTIAPLRSG